MHIVGGDHRVAQKNTKHEATEFSSRILSRQVNLGKWMTPYSTASCTINAELCVTLKILIL